MEGQDEDPLGGREEAFLPAIGAFGQLPLRVPCSPHTSDACSWKGRESPSVSCSTLVPDTENRCLGSHDTDLTAAGRASPLERQIPRPFPSSLAELFKPWKQQRPPSCRTSGNLGKDPKSRTGSQAWHTLQSWSLGGCSRELVELQDRRFGHLDKGVIKKNVLLQVCR